MPEASAPLRVDSVLATLRGERLLDLCRLFGCEIHDAGANKEKLVEKLGLQMERRLPAILNELGRDELRAVCRRHGLDAASRARVDLQARILEAAGIDASTFSSRPPSPSARDLPSKGQVVVARHRQWLVDDVVVGDGGDSPLVRLVCIDDDDPGRELDVLWNLELGARVIAPEKHGFGSAAKLDPPAHFGAYLHALKWSAVSAADATLFQAPFRAGIKLMAHQLTPLMKALELPRANLFIADDVGLGKTIEAGLVLQEMLLRQQASFVLVVCPASVCLQWQGEMQKRFGLRFEVMTRQFVAYRRQERGFGANPWSTHNRFIVSHALLRRPEHRDALLSHLGDRARKGLLIVDEAHNAAPASASKYATDTDTTRTLRDLAPRFDNRLFLSATPHNGHSNSFSALLEILDPVRFTRGVPVEGKKDLDAIMVRRLKRDLRQLGVESFPKRLLVEHSLRNEGKAWRETTSTFDAETGAQTSTPPFEVGEGMPIEIELSEKLARYTALCAPASKQARFPFVSLQQRLLSSPAAFAKTLERHVEGVEKNGGPLVEQRSTKERVDADVDLFGMTDEARSEEDAEKILEASVALPSPTNEARALLSDMRTLAEKARSVPDAKVRSLFAWMRDHMCPAIGLGQDTKARRAWSPCRVILFTEYGDTKRYLVDLLSTAAEYTDRGDERILQFHGGMSEEGRAQVQAAFNASPDKHPVRILVATDAAREGVNLQAHCADLFHIDLPWNPARLEQRNGRIDRTLQEAKEVRCHYFAYPQRTEDDVLVAVVRKIETIRDELGSLGAVLFNKLESTLEAGISAKTRAAVDRIGSDGRSSTVDEELAEKSRNLDELRADIDRAGRRLDASRRLLEVEPDSLRGVVDIGLRLSGADVLAKASPTSDGRPAFVLPTLDRSWDATLDTLRPARERDEDFYKWRAKAPRPVTFHPLSKLSEDAEQLHLAHPFVRRILDRFLAQGFSAHDLSRVTALVAPDESVVRVIVYARLTLFGSGAARLHDQLVPLAAAWSEGREVQPYKDRATSVAAVTKIERLLAGNARAPNATISSRIRSQADAIFEAMWPHVEAEADAIGVEAKQRLAQRARRESEDLRALLLRQRGAIDSAEDRLRQGALFNLEDKDQKRQVDLDLRHLDRRKTEVAQEIESEPRAIRALYDVEMTRLTPIGLVVAWPEMMT